MKKLVNHLELEKKRIEAKLLTLFPETSDDLLFEAARYSLLSPGKRLRPLLTCISGQIFEADPSLILYPACALECIHTFSLIHDDLPCMDNDDLRRGRPTLHKVYPESHALLTGDFLLNYAFSLLSARLDMAPQTQLALIQSLVKSTGEWGMIGGQALELLTENKASLCWETLSKIHEKKTAALFSSALEMGAILGKGTTQDRDLLVRIGKHFGIAFQILDDLEDGDGSLSILSRSEATSLVHSEIALMNHLLQELSVESDFLGQVLVYFLKLPLS